MKTLIISIKTVLIFTILTGIIYPLFITIIAQIVFPYQANGSIIRINEKAIGSELIAQHFDSCIYFTARPSIINYNPMSSGGSNLSLTNNKLIQQATDRQLKFRFFNQLDSTTQVPSEMLFASGSGLDPHISRQAALLQVNRIAQTRHLNDTQIQKLHQLINQLVQPPQFQTFGNERINVLRLNIELDKL